MTVSGRTAAGRWCFLPTTWPSTSSWPTPRPPIGPKAAPSTPPTPWSLRAPPGRSSTSSATRGRESNRLYVDTHYDPDPQPPTTTSDRQRPKRSWPGCCATRAPTWRPRHDPASAVRQRASTAPAEYQTLARCPGRALGRPARPIRSERRRLAAVRASAAHGPLLAAFRDAEARGLDVEATFPRLVAGRSLADADDIAAVLHGRVEGWTERRGRRRRPTT